MTKPQAAASKALPVCIYTVQKLAEPWCLLQVHVGGLDLVQTPQILAAGQLQLLCGQEVDPAVVCLQDIRLTEAQSAMRHLEI